MQEKAFLKTNFFGIYVHVPFCAHRCSYCGFYQELPARQNLDKFVEFLLKDIELQGSVPAPDTIYWGGGTPTILSPDHIVKIGESLPKNHPLLEWSVECSPGTVTVDKLRALKKIGVTRLTMGIQSFNERIMNTLGRRQKPGSVFKAYDMLRECGFDNIGIDLIFAIPGQSIDQWIEDLKTALLLSPEHISTYNLTYEGDSKLNNMKLSKELIPQNEADEIEFFVTTDRFLTDHGYEHYEVSNFCKPGYESVHNFHTWEMYDWIGYGPSASSQFKNMRFTNIPSLKLWAEGIKNKRHNRCDFYALNDTTLIQDSLIFGLRMFKGVDLDALETRFPTFNSQKYQNFFEKLVDSKLAERKNNRIKLTLQGMLVVDRIGSEILSL